MDVDDKAEAPGGAALLKIIGHIYRESAKQNMNRFFGFEAFISNISYIFLEIPRLSPPKKFIFLFSFQWLTLSH